MKEDVFENEGMQEKRMERRRRSRGGRDEGKGKGE
jgi:hypothetical protein